MARQLKDWLDGFCQYASTYNTTPAFAEWAGIWQLSTAVGRACAMQARGNALYPNMYLLMCGGPGTGKSQAVNAVKSVFNKACEYRLIPPSVTRAGLEDYMVGNLQQRVAPDGSMLMCNECIGLSEEMQGILPDQDVGHLTLYNILYDLPDQHKAVTRSNGELKLDTPYASILTGAQPAFLATAMPEQAWGMGFMSRSLLVFDTPRDRKSVFELSTVDLALKQRLIADLSEVHKLNGWFSWSKSAVALYEEWWVKKGGPPVPQSKRLAMGYNARRELHFLKLAMTMSLSRCSDLIVEQRDVERAILTLLKAEERMRHIFTEMANTGTMVAIQDLLDVVRQASAEGRPIEESTLLNILMQRFQPQQVHAVIDNLLSSGALEVWQDGKVNVTGRGLRKFKAGPKISLV